MVSALKGPHTLKARDLIDNYHELLISSDKSVSEDFKKRVNREIKHLACPDFFQ